MAINVAWEKKITIPWLFFPGSASVGAVNLGNGKLLAGLNDSGAFPESQRFYQSTDNGETWTLISSLPSWTTTWSGRLLHFPGGIVCYASTDGDQRDFFIHRSTDAGANWSLVKTFPSGGTHANGPWIQDATSYLRTHGAMVGGPIVDNDGATLSQIIYTEDAGETWLDGGVIQPAGPEDGLLSVQATPGEHFVYGVRRDLTYNAHPLLTVDGGHTTPPGPDGGAGEVLAVACLSETDFVAGGFGQAGSNEHYVYLWWSDDAGVTWNNVPASDFVGWPTSGELHAAIRGLHRITKDCVAACAWDTTGSAPQPIVLSIDGGRSYTIPGTGWDIADDEAVMGQGHMARTDDGHLIAVIERSPGASAGAELWRGTLTC